MIGPYELLSRLGSGGMGTVYLAKGPDGTKVALKAIRRDFAADPVYRARFHEEVSNARKVASFCTARVLDHGEHEGILYLVTEYIDGISLEDHLIQHGRLSPSMLHAAAVGVAAALTAIHAAGLVHRDLKPANVMLTLAGPRVIDFGLAKSTHVNSRHTNAGMVMGTPGWIAPEQVFEGRTSPAGDVFSWGSLIAYAGLGGHPFGEGDAYVMAARARTAPPDLRGLPAPLDRLVAAAIHPDPARRPTAKQLLLELVSATDEPAAQLAATRHVTDSWNPAEFPPLAQRPHPAGGPPRPGPHGEVPPRQGPHGDVPPRQGPHGEVPPRQGPHGEVPQGPHGEVRPGEVRPYPAPHAAAPQPGPGAPADVSGRFPMPGPSRQAPPPQGGQAPPQTGQVPPSQGGQAPPQAGGGQAPPPPAGQVPQAGQAPQQGGQAPPPQAGQAPPPQAGQAQQAQGGPAGLHQGGQASPQTGQAAPSQAGQAPPQGGQAPSRGAEGVPPEAPGGGYSGPPQAPETSGTYARPHPASPAETSGNIHGHGRPHQASPAETSGNVHAHGRPHQGGPGDAPGNTPGHGHPRQGPPAEGPGNAPGHGRPHQAAPGDGPGHGRPHQGAPGDGPGHGRSHPGVPGDGPGHGRPHQASPAETSGNVPRPGARGSHPASPAETSGNVPRPGPRGPHPASPAETSGNVPRPPRGMPMPPAETSGRFPRPDRQGPYLHRTGQGPLPPTGRPAKQGRNVIPGCLAALVVALVLLALLIATLLWLSSRGPEPPGTDGPVTGALPAVIHCVAPSPDPACPAKDD